jgi:hypothetical protein
VKIILEPSDFNEHAGPQVGDWVRYALTYAYRLEVIKQAGREPEASLIDVNRQMVYNLVGPIDVELTEPTKDANRKAKPERKG